MSNEFRVMNSPEDLDHVRIGDWKLVPGLVLVAVGANYDVRERGGGRYVYRQSARVPNLHVFIHKHRFKLRTIHKRTPENSPVDSVIVTKILSQEISRDKKCFFRTKA